MKHTKYFPFLLALVVAAAAVVPAVFAAVGAGTISVVPLTSTSVEITFDGDATTYDSLYICNRVLTPASADTNFVAFFDSTTTDSTYTGLSPKTGYVWFAVARLAGTTAISNSDTVATYKVPVQDTRRDGFLRRRLFNDASWTIPSADTTLLPFFTLNGVGASDYSCIFQAKEYNGADLILSQAGDSCAVGVYFYAVNCNTSWSDTTFTRESTITDSIPSETTVGLTRQSLSLKVGQFYQAYLYSHTGNGKNTFVTLDMSSVGGE